MTKWMFVPALLGASLVLACGCQRADSSSDAARHAEPDATQRFFSGRARPGEFQRLQQLPDIPPTFEEPEP
ncbi:hypothetical protein ACQKC8_09865 [Stutzerimonas stutzeri]|uniref:hypothetical protein n=1 Tax=Stutzerimonas stutzeri TaxID=316 RepID=UPI003C2BA35B